MNYTINPGHSFLDRDGSIKTGGDVIELSDDVAAAQRDKVTPVPGFLETLLSDSTDFSDRHLG